MKKVLIIHTWGIGDLIMITSALREFKEKHSDWKIDFLFFPKFASLPIVNSEIPNKIFYSSYKLKDLFKTTLKIRKVKYDYSFFTSGVTPWKAALFQFFIKSKHKIGEICFFPFFKENIKFNSNIHRLDSTIKILKKIDENFNPESRNPSFFFTKDEIDFGQEWKKENKKGKLIGFHPGSHIKSKYRRWSKEYFVELINKIKDNYPNFKLFIFSGPAEMDVAEFISLKTGLPVISNLSLGKIAAILSNFELFINSDSMMGHLASCFDVKVFTIFGPANHKITAPVSDKSDIIRIYPQVACYNCSAKYGKKCNRVCLHNLTPEQVYNFIKERNFSC